MLQTEMGLWTARYIGFSMFLALMGAFTTVIFSPIKQLVEGTPEKLWPKLIRKTKYDLPVNAMKIQALLVIAFLLLVSFGGKNAKLFFQIVISMTNVAMSLPYLFIAYAYMQFRKKNDVGRPFTFFKKDSSAQLASIVVLLTVGLAIIFTLIAPILQGQFMSTVWMIVGPIIFAGVAILSYQHYEKNN